MPRAAHPSVRDRAGFTLVELLVVIGLLLLLVTLAVLIIPSINNAQQATQGATQLQQLMEIAKQTAMRDRAPRGWRLLPSQGLNGSVQVTDLIMLEQPPDLYLGSMQVPDRTTYAVGPNAKTTAFTRWS